MANARAQPYKLLTYSMQHTTTACHAEQQQQPAFARGERGYAARNRRRQVLPTAQVGPAFTSQAFTRWRHQSEVSHI